MNPADYVPSLREATIPQVVASLEESEEKGRT